jgi:hypothetical protein
MKILTIGQPDSPHTESFLRRIKIVFPDCKSYFFASSPFNFKSELSSYADELIRSPAAPIYYQAYWQDLFVNPLSRFSGNPADLVDVINKFTPDFININAIQDAGYLLLEALRDQNLTHKSFVVNLFVWGNDLYYFRHHPRHKEKITQVLEIVDNLIPESSREVKLAWDLGFKGRVHPPLEATLVTFEELSEKFASPKQKSQKIVVKSSFQSSRTLNAVALRALAQCSDLLAGWEIVLIAPSLEDWRNLQPLMDKRIVSISASTGYLSKENFYSLLSESRLMISLNVSDGVSNSFLECCAARTYPVLSTSACILDWGQNAAAILDPYDVVGAIESIRNVLLDTEKMAIFTQSNYDRLKRYESNHVNAAVRQIYTI